MCGIFGITSEVRTSVAPIIVEALRRLEYRGYDSVGVATVHEGKLYLRKAKGKLREVEERLHLSHLPGRTGVGHTRWATHGPPADHNAHPHVDCRFRIAVVHNGIISNYLELRQELQERGHVFRSETDTEVIAHLIEEYLEEGCDLLEAVLKTCRRLRGSYAIAVISTQYPDEIVCAANESPLVLGLGSGEMYCCSDLPALTPLTSKYIKLLDGDAAHLTPETYVIVRIEDGRRVERRIGEVSWSVRDVELQGYRYYMLKEIHEQPTAIRNTLHGLETQESTLREVEKILLDSDLVVFTGCGTSYHACLVAQYLLTELCGLRALAVVASEFRSVEKVLSKESTVFAISQSGETADVLTVIRRVRSTCRTVALVNVLGSSLTFLAEHILYTVAGPEISVVATKTYTTQLTVLTYLTTHLARETGKLTEGECREILRYLYEMPRIVREVIEEYETYTMELSKYLAEKVSMLYLSRGVNVATAKEGALKMKEISYIHAEAYPAGEMKHGPLALVEWDYPVVLIEPVQEELARKLLGNLEEVKARGAVTVLVTHAGESCCSSEAHHIFRIPLRPETPLLEYVTPIPYIVPLQLLAYYTALERGCDPDRPRNLAKSVTVE